MSAAPPPASEPRRRIPDPREAVASPRQAATGARFYQTGTFAVGNRLLEASESSVQADPERANAITKGHRACQGCGEALGARYALDAALRATGGRLIAANATGCLEVFSTPFPESSWRLPWIHSLFANAPAVATGIAAALRAQGRTDIRVIGQGGDGGTVDIGLACLSGMFERGDDVLYVCYDNEAYMNTGVQRSAATPPAARTATTEPLPGHPGNAFGQGKNMPLIAMAHEIPYVATATVAELRDLEAKVERAMALHGPRYIHVLVPCPLGWGSATAETIAIARLAKETGLFPVFEAEDGRVSGVSPIRRLRPVEDYLRRQKRYAHLFAGAGQPEVVARLQALADRNVERFGLLAEEEER
ncbi:MAG TPA: thiamine pyrophosphate-dependent enzyme [Solirubrobacteraceae bacterium]|nr:thiamine pyrophosphate-dependent enzyme [Solirubrobacteraceae bacterium]